MSFTFKQILFSLKHQLETGSSNKDDLDSYFQSMDINILPEEVINNIIIFLLKTCIEVSNPEGAKLCIELWGESITSYMPMKDIDIETYQTENTIKSKGKTTLVPLKEINPVAEIFYILYIDNTILQYVVDITEESIETLLYYMIEMKNVPETSIVCNKLLNFYRIPSRFEELIKYSLDKNNYYVYDFLFQLKKSTSQSIEKPKWIISYNIDDTTINSEAHILMEQIKDIKISDDFTDDLYDMFLEFLDTSDILYDDDRVVIDMISEVSLTTKQIFLKKLLEYKIHEDTTDELELQRLYGMRNRFNNDDFDMDEYKEQIYAEHMMTCTTYNDENGFDGGYFRIYDWFTGSCEFCGLKINNRRYSVRKPHKWGGWTGCYCSWQCVRDDSYDVYPLKIDTQPLTNFLVDHFETKLNQVGLYVPL